MNIKRLYVLMSLGMIIFSGMHVEAFSFSIIKKYFCKQPPKTVSKWDLDYELIKDNVVKVIPILQDIVETKGKNLTPEQQNDRSYKIQLAKGWLENLYEEYSMKHDRNRNRDNYFVESHRVKAAIRDNKINELTDPWDFLGFITYFFRAVHFNGDSITTYIEECADYFLITINRLNEII